MNRRYQAFTLIELLVVIAIILVLMGMVILGVRKIGESTRSSSTKVTLEQCRSFISEYGRANGLPLPSEPLDLTATPDSTVTPAPTTAVPAYWPGDLRTESNLAYSDTGRYGVMTRYTAAVIGRMMQAPAIKSAVQGLPANSLLVIPPTVTFPAAPVFAAGTFYPTQISQRNGGPPTTAFMCMTRHVTAAGTNDPGVGTRSANFWLDLSLTSQAVLVDAFGNPILFFPACGFVTGTSGNGKLVTSAGSFIVYQPDVYWTTGRTYRANRDYVAYQDPVTSVSSLYKCILDNVAAAGNDPAQVGSVNWVRVATVPFFASAGPDGVFFDPARPETLDDNVYSFEN